MYPVGLTKTLSGIYYDSISKNSSSKKMSTTTPNNKISTNSHLLNQLQLRRKRHLEMRVMKQNYVFISNSYYLLEQVKKSENSFQTVSTIQFSTWEAENSLDVELLIELVRQFQLFRIQNLTVLKITKIILLLVGVFQVFRFALLLIQCYFNIIFSFSDRVGNETWFYFSTQNFQF